MERGPVVKKVWRKTGETRLYSVYIYPHVEVMGVSVSLASMAPTSANVMYAKMSKQSQHMMCL
jgi:muconolactone delta-isomerase